LVYADDVNIRGGKNTEALLVGSQEIALEVNAVKTNYMVMSRNQKAGRSPQEKIKN
jgi:hypothetical protein